MSGTPHPRQRLCMNPPQDTLGTNIPGIRVVLPRHPNPCCRPPRSLRIPAASAASHPAPGSASAVRPPPRRRCKATNKNTSQRVPTTDATMALE